MASTAPKVEKEGSAKKLNLPKPFTGKRHELKKFLQDVLLFLLVNKKIYETDEDRIVFALSFFEEGDAASWKEQMIEEKMKTEPLNLGTWDAFVKALKTSFEPYDAPGDALEEMKNMRLRDGSIDQHIANFKMAVTRSGLSEDSPAVIDYFRDSLTMALQRRIMTLEDPPTTLEKWCKWAQKTDNNYKKMQRVIDRSKRNTISTNDGKKREEPTRRWILPKRDPNAMDVDSITTEQREEMMKKGLCFKCGKPGHRSRDHKEGEASTSTTKPPTYSSTWKTPNQTSNSSTSKKMSGKELFAHVRALTAQMEEGEKETFYEEAEKEGF